MCTRPTLAPLALAACARRLRSPPATTSLPAHRAGDGLLYALEARSGNIAAFTVNANGTLTARPDTPAGEGSSGLQETAAY